MAIQIPYTDGFIHEPSASNAESKANKGAPNGYAPLDGNAKVPSANLPVVDVSGQISTHNSSTTSVHGITDTANLATKAYADGANSTHNSATTSVHGITNTAELIHSTVGGPNTDKVVTFNQSGGNGSEIVVSGITNAGDGYIAGIMGWGNVSGTQWSDLNGTYIKTSMAVTPSAWNNNGMHTPVSGTFNYYLQNPISMGSPNSAWNGIAYFLAPGNRSGWGDPNNNNLTDPPVNYWRLVVGCDWPYTYFTNPSTNPSVFPTTGWVPVSASAPTPNEGLGYQGSDYLPKYGGGFSVSVGGGTNSEIGAWGFGVAGNNADAYIEPTGLTVEGSGKSILIEADKITFELGGTGNRTTLVGSASGSDKTITLPNATGTIALTSHTHLISDISDFAGLPNVNTSTSDGAGGFIDLSGGTDSEWTTAGNAGSIDLSGGEGGMTEEQANQNGGNGGSLLLAGEDLTGANGGTIDCRGLNGNPGGSINTSDGGGSISTRGTGSIELGGDSTRTILVGSANGGNKTITLPNATGTIALTSDSRFTNARVPTSHTHGNISNDGKALVPYGGILSATNVDSLSNGTFTMIQGSGAGGVITILNGVISVTSAGTGYVNTVDTSTYGRTSGGSRFVLVTQSTQNASANLPIITTTAGAITTGSFGTTANTFCQGNDVRLGAQTIFTLGGEEKTSFAVSTSYYYAGMLTKASKSFAQAFDSGNPTLGLRILGNWTIKAIAIHENLASSSGSGGISSATRTYKIVNLASSSVVTDLVTNMSITNGALFNVITLENQSVNISSGANLALVLTTGSSGNLPLGTGTTTISANIYCVPR